MKNDVDHHPRLDIALSFVVLLGILFLKFILPVMLGVGSGSPEPFYDDWKEREAEYEEERQQAEDEERKRQAQEAQEDYEDYLEWVRAGRP